MQSIRHGIHGIVPAIILVLVLSSIVSRPVLGFKIGESASLVIGQPSFVSSTRSSGLSGLWNPLDVSFDSLGNLWVADNNNCRVLEYLNPLSSDESASLVIGQSSLTATTCSVSKSGFFGPAALTFDSKGDLWVVDQAGCRVLKFNPPFSDGENASLVIGEPDFYTTLCYVGLSDTQRGLTFPQGIAFDASGDLWVSDDGSSRLLEFAPPFINYQNASLVLGQPDFASFGCHLTHSGLCFPGAIGFDATGNLWASDGGNNRVLRFNSPFSNYENAAVVIGQSSFTTNTCITTQSGLCRPSGLALDTRGNLWVADRYNSRILEFKNPFLNGESATLVVGQSDFTAGAGSCNPTQSGLCNPATLTFDLQGNLWAADQNDNRVLAFARHHSI